MDPSCKTAGSAETPPAPCSSGPVRRMRRAERRQQIMDAAARAFARTGFAGTGLDEIAAEAGVTKVILYRHFDSKADLYRAVFDRIYSQITGLLGTGGYDHNVVATLLHAATLDPDGFRLLFRHAARELEFRDLVDGLTAASATIARRELASRIQEGPWLDWAVQLLPVLTIEAVLAWLDVGQPDPAEAADRIGRMIRHTLAAAEAGTDSIRPVKSEAR
ncbi:TetR/AcrR family transcriptional regulator [Lentzea sp. NPDC004782]|uniref:TetR/AcrR family transcriptional regulator n=1 Tax=Lentzea sp. NPDC004782 TaxID=3154458 RepID=UPI0033A5EEBA